MFEAEIPAGVKAPNPSARIWRYLSFPRFKQLLEEKTLYFSRIDQFSDFNEGRISGASSSASHEELAEQGDDGHVANAHDFMLRLMSTHTSYAVCWNESMHETNLMWRAYGQIPNETPDDQSFKIAISTTAERLLLSIDGSRRRQNDKMYKGMVNYLDFDKDPTPNNAVEKCFVKRLEYASENELRLIINRVGNLPSGTLASMPQADLGVVLPVKITDLIDAIYIEPVAIDQVQLGTSGTSGQDQSYAVEISSIMEKRISLVTDLVSAEMEHAEGVLSGGVQVSNVL